MFTRKLEEMIIKKQPKGGLKPGTATMTDVWVAFSAQASGAGHWCHGWLDVT